MVPGGAFVGAIVQLVAVPEPLARSVANTVAVWPTWTARELGRRAAANASGAGAAAVSKAIAVGRSKPDVSTSSTPVPSRLAR